MSHTTTLKTLAITDVSALQTAADRLKAKGINCDLLRNAKPRMYYSDQHGACDYVLKLHDCPYDLGFDKQADGTYSPVFDEWAGHVAKQIGATCPVPSTPEGKAQHKIGAFMQQYAAAAAENAAIAQGYMVASSTIDAAGNIQLVINA